MSNLVSAWRINVFSVVGLLVCFSHQPTVIGVESQENGPFLGLFVQERWRTWTSLSKSRACGVFEASSCVSNPEEGCIPIYTFLIENACYQFPEPDFTKNQRSERYFGFNSSHYCRQIYEEAGCSDATGEKTCDSLFSLRACLEGNPSSTNVSYYSDFCIKSFSPVDEFVVPMVENRLYGSEGACQVDPDNIYANLFVPSHPSICIPDSIVVSDERVLGSTIRSCNSNGSTSFDRFTDTFCSEQSSALQQPTTWLVDGCTPSDSLPGVNASQQRYTADCQNIQYHCKDLSQIEFFTKVETKERDSGPDESSDSTTSTARSLASSSVAPLLLLLFSAKFYAILSLS